MSSNPINFNKKTEMTTAQVDDFALPTPPQTLGVPDVDTGAKTVDPEGKPPRRFTGFARQFMVQLSAIALLIGIWWAVAAAEIWPPLLVPAPFDVFG